jgi:hypothetical protein
MRDRMVEVIIKARDLTANVIGGFRRNMLAVTRIAKDVTQVIVGTTAAMAAMVVGLGKMASRGSTVLAVQTSFVKIFGDQEAALQKLRKASYGLVTDFDLMQQANRAVTLGAVRTADEFAELTRLAQGLGDAQGIKLVDAQEKLVEGIGKANTEILRGIGLHVSITDAVNQYAAATGRKVSSLTQAERAEAFRTMAMEQARAKLEELGEAEMNAGDRVDQLAVAFGNLRDQLTKFAAESPALDSFFQGMSGIVTNLTAAVASGDTALLKDAFSALGRIAGNAFSVAVRETVGGVRGFLSQVVETMRPRMDANLERGIEDMKSARGVLGLGGGDRRGIFDWAFDGVESALTDSAEEAKKNIVVAMDELAEIAVEARRRQSESALAAVGGVRDQGRDNLPTGELGLRGASGGGGAGGSTTPFVIPEAAFRQVPAAFAADAIAAYQTRMDRVHRARLAPGGVGVTPVAGLTNPYQGMNVGAQIDAETIGLVEDAGETMGNAGRVAAASMFSAAEAMVRGSGRIEESLVNMVTSVLQSIPKIGGGIWGTVIGGVGGLIAAAFSRGGNDRGTVPVRLKEVDDAAARKMQGEGQTIRITNITEIGGTAIETIERELRVRQNRDEVWRR